METIDIKNRHPAPAAWAAGANTPFPAGRAAVHTQSPKKNSSAGLLWRRVAGNVFSAGHFCTHAGSRAEDTYLCADEEPLAHGPGLHMHDVCLRPRPSASFCALSA